MGTIRCATRFQPEPRTGKGNMSINLKTLSASAVLAAALALSACGTTPGDRAVSGGLLGAGAGAAIGSLSGNAGAGAVIGGLGGGAVGPAAHPCRPHLRGPRWRDH